LLGMPRWRGSSVPRWKRRSAGVVKKNADHSFAVKSARARECGIKDGHLFSPGEKLNNANTGPEAGVHSIGKKMRNLKLIFRVFLFHFGNWSCKQQRAKTLPLMARILICGQPGKTQRTPIRLPLRKLRVAQGRLRNTEVEMIGDGFILSKQASRWTTPLCLSRLFQRGSLGVAALSR
jgi:hypothetical protein